MERLAIIAKQCNESHDKYNSRQNLLANTKLQPESLKTFLFGNYGYLRDEVYEFMKKDPTFIHYHLHEMTKEQVRAQSVKQAFGIAKALGPSYETYINEPMYLTEFINTINMFEEGVCIKLAVHYNLYLRTIVNLGTMKHVPFIKRALALEDYGCYGMTELGHGSNVQMLQTTAIYEHETKSFILNNPFETSMKFWIGAAAEVATMSVIFARLYVKNEDKGIHIFIVPIRNPKDRNLLPGVIIGDCGMKTGLNAIDNGFIMLRNVRIPKDYLLNRFSDIDENGNFQTSVPNDNKRFGMMLGSLCTGRVAVSYTITNKLFSSLLVAYRFASNRKQFGPPKQPEGAIINYPQVRMRIIPRIVACFVYQLASKTLINLWNNNQKIIFDPTNVLLNELHAIISCVKANITWEVLKSLQECRELLGGLGYSAYANIGPTRDNIDVTVTFEGDNHVLLQQTSKFLVSTYQTILGGGTHEFKSLRYLKKDGNLVIPCLDPKKENEFFDLMNIEAMINFKVNKLVIECFQKMQELIGEGNDPWDAWNKTNAVDLKLAAQAYFQSFAYRSARKMIVQCSHLETKKVLQNFLLLWGIEVIYKDPVCFFAYDVFKKEHFDAIKNKMISLSMELTVEAGAFLEILAPPDEIIGSPLARTDGDIYQGIILQLLSLPTTFGKPKFWQSLVKKT